MVKEKNKQEITKEEAERIIQRLKYSNQKPNFLIRSAITLFVWSFVLLVSLTILLALIVIVQFLYSIAF